MPLPIIAAICWVCGSVAACYCAKKAHDAYKKGQKTKRLKYEYTLEEKKAARENNEKLQPQREEKQKEQEKQEQENKQLEQQVEEARNKSNDPMLPKEEQDYWRGKFIELEEKLSRGKNKSKNLRNEIKELDNQIKNNNQIISSTGSNLVGDDRNWVWQFLTLENILIMLAIYAVWKIVRDEQR